MGATRRHGGAQPEKAQSGIRREDYAARRRSTRDRRETGRACRYAEGDRREAPALHLLAGKRPEREDRTQAITPHSVPHAAYSPGSDWKRYPTPRTVRRWRGFEGSRSM